MATEPSGFVQRAVESRVVWTVWGQRGPIVVDAREAKLDVYLFFSDEALAEQVLRARWPGQPYTTRRIELFDLLYRWLSGMSRDGHLCGVDWTGAADGVELEPFELKWQLIDTLPPDVKASYEARLPP